MRATLLIKYSFTSLTLAVAVSLSAIPALTQTNNSLAPNVTATALGARVRFTAPSSVAQIRLEIYDSMGKKLFDNEVRGGNVLDWHLQDGQAEPLADDTYLCIVTVKSISGRMTQRIGSVRTEKSSAILRPIDISQLTTPQSQAIGPVEENASLTILNDDDNQTPTVIAHNGNEGQIIRGRGALSFRLGDFFSGKDIEQMRLTEQGNLGIGTFKPGFKLDVAGAIRAREGFVFNDGSTLNVNDKGTLTLTTANGNITANITGTGTQNRLAKWTDNSGTLGDSVVTELNGNVGVGTSSPSAKFHLHAGLGQAADVRMTNDSISSPFNFGGALPNNLGARFTFAGVNEGGLAAQGFTDANAPAFRFQGHIGSTAPTQIPVIFEGFKSNGAGNRAPLGATEKVYGFYNGAFDAGGTVLMSMTGNGNVGIGTTSPQGRLHVTGDAAIFDYPDGAIRIPKTAGALNAEDLAIWNKGGSGGQPFAITGWNNNNGIYINTSTGNVGIGTASQLPKAKLDVRGDVKLGSSGQLYAPGGEEKLRIIRGVVICQSTPSIVAGAGFSVTRRGEGDCDINFGTPFGGTPSITATAYSGTVSDSEKFALIGGVGTGSAEIIVAKRSDGSFTDWTFFFIAIGPR